MSGDVAARRRGTWSVAGLNAAVGVVILLVVAVLALVVNPPAPPGIAAFAPQANKPITKAPLSQSAEFGEGDGGCAAGQECAAGATTTTTAPPDTFAVTTTAPPPKGAPQGVPSSLQCYEWPDGTVTQVFDPQSPPCIATWDAEKGNGGATSPGVTETEVRIAFPQDTSAATSAYPHLQPIVDFFNSRFQFYGRKIRMVPFPSQQATQQALGTGFNDPEMQRADAAEVTQLNVFGSTDFIDPLAYSFSLPVFRELLSRNKILSINGGEVTPYGTSADLSANAPYEWTYYPTLDPLMNNLGTVVCRQLAGKPASHAPDPAFRGMTRKFALVLPTDQKLGGPLPGLSQMVRKLDGCGISAPRILRYNLEENDIAPLSAAFNELHSEGVTSVIIFPYTGAARNDHPMTVASRVNYRPEWVVAGWNSYLTASLLNTPTNETEGAFGIGIWNKMQPLGQEFWERAYVAAGGDQAKIQNGVLYNGRAFYNAMLLVASGIQMAGPNLTPETFAEGLQSTRFPNPGAGAPPFYQAAVGFGPGDVAMTDDYNAFWLDIRMTGGEVGTSKNVNVVRAFCHVALGRRWFDDIWPTVDGFYAGSGCR